MSSESFIEDATTGLTKGFLEFSADKINEFVQKLKDKKLAFIEESRTIEIVKEQYKSAEVKVYQTYIKDKELLFLIRIGLTLRKIENDQKRRENLRDKIFRKFGVSGLHVAEFVQNGILNRYTGMLLEEIKSIDDLEKKISYVLKNIDKHALFVQWPTSDREILNKSNILINANSPSIFVIAGFKMAASLVRSCLKQLQIIFTGYDMESISSNDKEILFFRRKLI